MAVQEGIQTRVAGIIRYTYMLHPYCFSSNGISVKSSQGVPGPPLLIESTDSVIANFHTYLLHKLVQLYRMCLSVTF